jgi:hypothetical protein
VDRRPNHQSEPCLAAAARFPQDDWRTATQTGWKPSHRAPPELPSLNQRDSSGLTPARCHGRPARRIQARPTSRNAATHHWSMIIIRNEAKMSTLPAIPAMGRIDGFRYLSPHHQRVGSHGRRGHPIIDHLGDYHRNIVGTSTQISQIHQESRRARVAPGRPTPLAISSSETLPVKPSVQSKNVSSCSSGRGPSMSTQLGDRDRENA